MPFELRPFPTPTLRPEGDYLQQAWSQSVYPLAAKMGVEIKLPTVSPQPHTHLAFEGFQYAKEHAKGNQYNSRLLRAFFQEGEDIGQIDVLTKLATEVGLDEENYKQALETREYLAAHEQALGHAAQLGITAVPAFQIGEHLLPGLQSKETISRAIEIAGDGK